MLELVTEHWNNGLTIIATIASLVVGYRQYRHLGAQSPSIEIDGASTAQYVDAQDEEGREVLYNITCTVGNEGYQSDTVVGSKLISPPPWRGDPRRWSSWFEPKGDAVVDLSTDGTEIEATDSVQIPLKEHGRPLVDGMLESEQPVDALLVIETRTDQAFTDITLKYAYSD